MRKLLVANRGEIAIRVLRAAADLGVATVAVHSDDDALSLPVREADEARALPGAGAAAYTATEALLAVARDTGCDAVHPGYGFLSEHAGFAARCAEAGVVFVGPRPETLALFGDKVAARALAARHDVPVLAGSAVVDDDGAGLAFMASLGEGAAVVVKAVAGGGGRGMRVVRHPAELPAALARCRSEAAAAFGDASVYLERLVERARHVEVQVVGDGTGAVVHLGERDCTLQRRHQKLVEMAPCPVLSAAGRDRVAGFAVRMAADAGYASLGTFEFLLDVDDADATTAVFIEANPRLQVEHTVTEEVTGLDLVAVQLRLAGGASLAEVGLADQAAVPAPRGVAVQARVNTETMGDDGAPRPTGGVLAAFEAPTGPGVRTDTFGYAGYATNPRFDSLLAKVVAHAPGPGPGPALARLARALSEFRVEGVPTNIAFLQALLAHPELAAGRVHTRFVEEHAVELVAGAAGQPRRRWFEAPATAPVADDQARRAGAAGTRVDPDDPLAVLAYGKSGRQAGAAAATAPAGTTAVTTPVQGTVVSVDVAVGDTVAPGQQLLVMEAMKMEHVIAATVGGVVREVAVAPGDTVYDGTEAVFVEEGEVEGATAAELADVDLDAVRPDLAQVLERHAMTRDDARPDAVRRRHEQGMRTARENLAALCDPGTYVEYGALAVPTGLDRPVGEVMRRYPADGIIAGVGTVNGELFAEPASRCAVLSYDYTVLAGTQGTLGHRKTDRVLEMAHEARLPVVFLTEGGGGRAGQRSPFVRRPDGQLVLNQIGGSGDTGTWRRLGALSGLVPIVGVNAGFCFAGNAAVLGCCDVIIATRGSSIGMGGPAMVEGGGLGVYRPEDIGPMDVQVANGVVDVEVADEAEAVAVAKRYLSYFQGPLPTWEAPDQRLLRHAVPENRLRTYDVRRVIEVLADTGSVLELRAAFGREIVTAFIRVEGRPVGVIANNPQHLAGAIDSDGADKAARFIQLCDAFDIPVLSLCDTPGIMVGPEAEKGALVRHASRLFVAGANLTVPFIVVVLRKAYGLGIIAMAAGSLKATTVTVSWPTGEYGGMGLEGMVKLGHRAELAAIEDPAARMARYQELVARAYENGKALNNALSFGVDDVIDPADTRAVVARTLAGVRPPAGRDGKKRPSVDVW